MIFYVVFNPLYDNQNVIFFESFSKKINELGHQVIANDEIKQHIPFKQIEFFDDLTCRERCDMVVSIGGDGTFLHNSRIAIASNKPILGINAGRIGFLCAFEAKEINDITKNDIEELFVESRMLLETNFGNENFDGLALNDITFYKGAVSKTTEFSILCDGKMVAEYRADGLIVSTPTGSTAYSLSAGGPIVQPSIELILLTPICAHSLFSRSIAIPPNGVITIRPKARNREGLLVSNDSEQSRQVPSFNDVLVRKSKKNVLIAVSPKRDYYKMLRTRISNSD